jgi:metallo-beta-lactamase family protein
MKLTFIGADHEVTGSCHVVEVNGYHLLLDYGLEQGVNEYVNRQLPVAPDRIDALILSHAHMDHSGRIPQLVRDGFAGPVYCTAATRDLCAIMLKDGAHIQQSDAEYQNRKNKRAGRPLVQPLYDLTDAENALKLFQTVEYGESFSPVPGVTARLEDVGHLLGSASVHLTLQEGQTTRTLVFSGDIGNHDQPILRDPGRLSPHDYVVMECTYGDRRHEPVADPIAPLAQIMQETFDRGGNVVVPCFAVGRTQQMLYFLREIRQRGLVQVDGDYSVYVDSPLAVEATQVFEKNVFGYYDEAAMALVRQGVAPLRFQGLKMAVTTEQSKAINTDPQCKVILSASGMCEAGRIRHHLKYNLWRPESTILFAGYQAQGTLGRALLDGAETVKIFGETIKVAARIAQLPNVSSHADRDGLIQWLSAMTVKPSQVFVVHGEDAVCDRFCQLVFQQCGFPAAAPYSGDRFDLAQGEWLSRCRPVAVEKPAQPAARKAAQRQDSGDVVESALARLTEVVRGGKRSNKEKKQLAKEIRALAKRWQ